ncbi:MAG: uracil-DNA glycosylase [Hyphomicrobiales bacterium]
MTDTSFPPEAPYDCARCDRLFGFLEEQRQAHADWYNGPVTSFGDDKAQVLIVGLAPGMQGANRTGRPFTGDWAGDLLYGTLAKFGFSNDRFDARPDDGLELNNCMITNAVRCLPPQNKPVAAEIRNCNPYLTARIAALPNLCAIVTLGRIAHEATLIALGERKSARKFAHGAQHEIGNYVVHNSYHCSRYNTNTGVLTTKMFESIFENLEASL